MSLMACDHCEKPADNMVIISKDDGITSGTHDGQVRYGIWCYGSKTVDVYFYSKDRSFDVGDHLKLIKKEKDNTQ